MKLGAWTEVQEDTVLIVEDTTPEHLKFIVGGTAAVAHSQRIIGEVHRGDFLGEMSYLSGKKASATVTTQEAVRYLAFDRERLRDHLARNTEVRHALETSFNRNLADKLVKSNASDINKSPSNGV